MLEPLIKTEPKTSSLALGSIVPIPTRSWSVKVNIGDSLPVDGFPSIIPVSIKNSCTCLPYTAVCREANAFCPWAAAPFEVYIFGIIA